MVKKGKTTTVISLDPIHHRVTVDDAEAELQPLTFALFAKLYEHRNEVVANDTLSNEVWGNVTVAPDTLKQRVFLLRRALEDAKVEGCYIQSVRGQGYRLVVAEVTPTQGVLAGRSPWVMVVAVVAVLAAVYALRSGSAPDLPSNNRIVFWRAVNDIPAAAEFSAWEQLWITQLSSSDDIRYLESTRNAELTLPVQARQARAALISYWVLFEHNAAPQIRMQIIEPKTAATLRSDVVAIGDHSGMSAALAEQVHVIERILASDILPLSREALVDTGHPAWARLRELAASQE